MEENVKTIKLKPSFAGKSRLIRTACYEDNYPTTNLEAQACGTPCLTYRSGGSPESVPPENVVETGDIQALYEKILYITR